MPVTIVGLNVGKLVHKDGGVLMLVTFAMLVALPWVNVMKGTLSASVLALVPFNQIDLIAPNPQVLALGFAPLGSTARVAPLTIALLRRPVICS